MTSHRQRAIRHEIERRKKSGEGVLKPLLKLLSPTQRAFIEDPHRFKIARSGRRAGKSFADAVYLIKTCLETPGSPTLYLGLTRDSAKEAVWSILETILQTLDIPYEARPSALRITFPNGSFIQLFGADVPNARNRLRGRKFKLVVVDECGFFGAVDELVYVLLPSLADLSGSLVMTSSPGLILSGLFYEADVGERKAEWRQYHWNLLDNPHFMGPATDPKFKTKGEQELDLICRLQFGGNRNHPSFVREYLGEWVRDVSKLVYPVTGKNIISSIYEMPAQQHAIGVDLGSVSANAISVVRYSQYAREVQFIDVWKKAGVSVDEMAAMLTSYMEKYQTNLIVADTGGYGKGIVDELRRRYQLPIMAAEKTDKAYHQRIFANDLISNYIRVLQGSPLIDEWATILKDDDGEEIKGAENHAADASLYVYRKIYTTVLQSFEPARTEEEKILRELEESVIRDKEQEIEGETWWPV